jgi:hypothetical protein
MIFAGLIAAIGTLIIFLKLGIRKIISYDIPIDISITSFLMYAFSGTYSGMMAALIGGIVVSVVLLVMKKYMIREELVIEIKQIKLNKFINFYTPVFKWKTIYPT